MLLPLAVLALGVWEQQRGLADWVDITAERDRLTRIVEQLEARSPRDGKMDFSIQFRRNGQLFAGPLAVTQAQAARDEASTLARVMSLRRVLPPIVIWVCGIAAALSGIVLVAGALLGRMGRSSREVLVRGFALVRGSLPAVLAVQVVLATTASVAVVVFETAALFQPGIGSGEIKMIGVACILVLGSLYVAGTTLVGLRRALAAFEPEPLAILGREVLPDEAPGLWHIVTGLAGRLGALHPDAIVVGLTEGFFVSAGPKVLEPEGRALSGRTLYLPLPYLPLLRADELASIIGHELAHFAGGDTTYSQRFLPIYAGVGRSLDAVAAAGGGSSAFGLLGPAMRLGVFVMDQFHHAVRHWSRTREFAADLTGAGPTSPEAAVRALLRTAAIQPRIAEVLNEAAEAPGAAPADLVAAVLDRAIAEGLADPAANLETEQAHPTDTHPPTRERIAKLGCDLTPDLLADAATPPPRQALGRLNAYFADPAGISRAAGADFLTVVQRHDAAYGAHLEAMVSEVGTEERVLSISMRPSGYFLMGFGAFLIGSGLILLATGVPGIGPADLRVVTGTAGLLGAVFFGFGLVHWRQGEQTVLILQPDAMTVPGLDRPIGWSDIADLDMGWHTNRMITRVLVGPDAPFPQRLPRARRVQLDPKRRIVTINAALPRKMKPAEFAELIGRYRAAAEARRLLVERAGLSAPPPSHVQSN